MIATTGDAHSYVSAMFSDEFVDGGVDYDMIEQIHRGDFDEWLFAVAGSGLFTNSEVATMEREWQQSPKAFLDALLAEADEITRKRCNVTWAALDRVAPIAEPAPVAVFG
ncbi:hypothetical protein [Rhodococcus sp. NPDC058521]|uniref:hypothetical protein n=1 Tax=Rhodococcus sp. NPDC058521 TaxID=3346536 RepID=UPI003662EE1B